MADSQSPSPRKGILFPNYPSGCSDEQIREAISSYADDILLSQANINVVMQEGPLMQAGLNELQRRATDRLTDITRANIQVSRELKSEVGELKYISTVASNTAEKHQTTANRFTLVATILALVSTIASAVAIYFSYQTTITDKRWQQDEIKLLETISQNTLLKQ